MTTGTLNRLEVGPKPDFTRLLRIDESYGTPGQNAAPGINGRFDRLVAQSGTAVSPEVILRLCILGGVTIGGTVFVMTENLLATAAALPLGVILPVAVLLFLRARRRATMRRQMPLLIAALLEAARAGRGLLKGLEMAAAEMSAPLAGPVGQAARRLRMGVGVEAALADLPVRTGLAEMETVVAALGAHDRSGSDLVALLERLSRTIAA